MTKQHRMFSPEFKAQAVLAVLSSSKTTAEICRCKAIDYYRQLSELKPKERPFPEPPHRYGQR